MNKKETILLITSEYPPGPGGMGTLAHQLSKQLFEIGWDIHVFASQNYVSEQEILEFNKQLPFTLTFQQSKGMFVIKMWRKLRNILSAIKNASPSIIITTGDTSTFYVLGLNWLLRKKWVIIEHGAVPPNLLGRLKRRAIKSADLVIYVSNHSKNFTEQHINAKARISKVIWNGGDEEIFHQLQLDEIKSFKKQFEPGYPLLLTVGNVTFRKGQEVIIRALPEVKKHFPDILYLMAGKPTLKADLVKLAEELGVSENIRFLGTVTKKELVSLYNSADLFLMTSRHSPSTNEIEGFGIAVIEAALCGRTAVVSDNSGLKEAVVAGVTGLIAHENDPASTASAVIRVLSDVELRHKMEIAAFKRAHESLAWRMVAMEYDAMLKMIISKN